MYFDRFDICEAWYLWAHDWGEYRAIGRLQHAGFRPSPLLGIDSLSENAQVIYATLNTRSLADPDWYERKRLGRLAIRD